MSILVSVVMAVVLVCMGATAASLIKSCNDKLKLTFVGRRIRFSASGRFLTWKYRAVIRVTDLYTGEYAEISGDLHTGGEFNAELDENCKSAYRAEVTKLNVRLVWSFLWKKANLPESAVLPVGKTAVYIADDAEGTNPETLGVHEYRRGERLSDIHMKLSAKAGKYMVRETFQRGNVKYKQKAPPCGKVVLKKISPKRFVGLAEFVKSALIYTALYIAACCIKFVPVYCYLWGLAVIIISYAADKFQKFALKAVSMAMLIIPAAFGLAHLPSQAGRIINAVTEFIFRHYSKLYPIMHQNKSDIAAACFISSAAAWGIYNISSLHPDVSHGRYTRSQIIRAAVSAFSAIVLMWANIPQNICGRLTEIRYSAENFTQSNGDLSCKMPENDILALEVLMDEPQAMYLHGFLGYSYNNGCWKTYDMSESTFSREDFLYLKSNSFGAQNQAMKLFEAREKNAVTVRVTGADKRYMYLPITSEQMCDYPAQLESPAKDEVYTALTVGEVSTLPDDFAKALNSADEACIKNSAVLDKLYREEFTKIPDTIRHILEANFGEVKRGDTALAAKYVNEYLKSCNFSENACTLEDFMQSEKTGGAKQFASAAAVIFRYCGIPARYAEGYVITPEMTEGKISGSPIELTSKDFHAWCEYYVEGAGWSVFETSPEYLKTMPLAKGSYITDASEDIQSDKPSTSPQERDNGQRLADRIIDKPQDEKNHLTPLLIVLIMPGILAAVTVVYCLKVAFDRAFALSVCAKLLKLEADESGTYDFSELEKSLSERLEQLQAACLYEYYAPRNGKRNISSGALKTFIKCLFGRKRR